MDFGSSWFKVAGWKRASRVLTESIRGDLNSLQTSLSILYDHAKTGLSKSLQQQRAKIAAQRRSEKAMLHSRIESAAKTKKLVVAQTKDLIRTISGTLHESRAAASYAVKKHAEKITEDPVNYACNKSLKISRQSRTFARAATRSNVKALGGIRIFSQRHLREAQKKAVKMMWKVGGAPTKGLEVKGKDDGKGSSRSGKIFVRRDEL